MMVAFVLNPASAVPRRHHRYRLLADCGEALTAAGQPARRLDLDGMRVIPGPKGRAELKKTRLSYLQRLG